MKRAVDILLLALVVSGLSCCTSRSFQKRAERQLPVSLRAELSFQGADTASIQIHHLKTVYADDSVSLLQFTAVYNDSTGAEQQLDLRYIYLFDRFMSVAEGRPVFNEAFRQIPCMPDKKIKEARRTARKTGESVYRSVFGATLPVRHPIPLTP